MRGRQGCNLRGRSVAVVGTAGGGLALGPATAAAAGPAKVAVPTLFQQVFGSGEDRLFKYKKAKKHHGKGHGHWKDDKSPSSPVAFAYL